MTPLSPTRNVWYVALGVLAVGLGPSNTHGKVCGLSWQGLRHVTANKLSRPNSYLFTSSIAIGARSCGPMGSESRHSQPKRAKLSASWCSS